MADNFKKLYLRPNLSNSGTIPAGGPLSSCPDIWVSGDRPVVDYQKALATTGFYGKDCNTNLVYHKDNYIYVRGRNGADSPVSNSVSLYYADARVIQWPSEWKDNIIGTDINPKDGKAQISQLAKGEIGVGDRPFVWKNVPIAKSNSHYCLFAQFNDDQNSNPFPRVDTTLDMAKLVATNLQWGWRNVTVMDKKENVEFSYRTGLTVPLGLQDKNYQYMLYLKPDKSMIGCEISFMCSNPDSKGKIIEMKKTPVTSEDQILGCECTLEHGYYGLVSVYLYNPKKQPLPAGATLAFNARILIDDYSVRAANAMHLVETEFENLMRRHVQLRDANALQYALRLGSYTGHI